MVMKAGATLAATLTEAYQSSLNGCEAAAVAAAVRACKRRGTLTDAEHQQLRAEAVSARQRIARLKASRAELPEGINIRSDRPGPRPEPRMLNGGAHVPGRPQR